jgi:hypothetical protein
MNSRAPRARRKVVSRAALQLRVVLVRVRNFRPFLRVREPCRSS